MTLGHEKFSGKGEQEGVGLKGVWEGKGQV